MIVLVSYRALPETLPLEKRNPKLMDSVKDMLFHLVNLKFLLLCLALSIVMGGFFGYLAASPFVFQAIYGFSALSYSLLFAANALVLVLVAQVVGRLSPKFGEKNIVWFSLFGQLLASFVLLLMSVYVPKSPIFVALGLLVYLACMSAIQTACFTLVMDTRSGGAGSASGILGILGFLSGAVSSPLVGLMGELSFVPLALCMLSCTILALACFKFGLRLPKKVVSITSTLN